MTTALRPATDSDFRRMAALANRADDTEGVYRPLQLVVVRVTYTHYVGDYEGVSKEITYDRIAAYGGENRFGHELRVDCGGRIDNRAWKRNGMPLRPVSVDVDVDYNKPPRVNGARGAYGLGPGRDVCGFRATVMVAA